MDTKTADRIRAARVVAGYTTLIDPADRLGMTKAKYQKLEAGSVRLNPVDADRVAKLFSISRDYLVDGHAANDRERLISRIAGHLENHAGRNADSQMLERLVQARQKAGFPSGRAAAAHFGWKPQTLGAHERGTANLSVERLIGYGLAYRTSPEYLLYAEPPMDMPEIEGIGQWTDVRGAAEKAKPTDAANWRWLNRQTKSDAATIALMIADEAGLKKSGMPPMVLPAAIIRQDFVSPYGILQHDEEDRLTVLIVDPSILTGEPVVLEDGIVLFRPARHEGKRIAIDPLATGTEPLKDFYLGSLLAKVSIG